MSSQDGEESLDCGEGVADKKIRVLFLDIDGVLNDSGQQFGCPLARPECAKNFNRIIAETDAKVVVISNWRHLVLNGHMDRLGFEQLLRSHGVSCCVLGVTPDEPDGRGWQIRAWLDGKYGKIESWVVIDDCPDKLMLTMPLVQTNGSVGLTSENADQAIQILGGTCTKMTPTTKTAT